MELNEMEKKLLFQVEGDYQTKILNELYMTVRYSNNSEQREAAEGLMAKLRVLSNAECMDLVKDIQKNYRLPYPARTIGEKIAEARQQSGAEKLKGHDIMALERFDPEVKHMIVFDVYAKMSRGEYQSVICPYGYRKSADGRMEPDEDVASNVQMIFQWASEGNTAAEITRKLYAMNIPTPGEYRKLKGKDYYNVSRTNGVWSTSTVLRILEDQRYIGTYVIGKRKVKEIGSRHTQLKDESEWFKIPNHHPAIISVDLFEKANASIKRFSLSNKKPRDYLLRGKVFCGCCDHAMSLRNGAWFYCRHSEVAETLPCHGVRIKMADLEQVVFETIRAQMCPALGIDSNKDKLDLQTVQQAEHEEKLRSIQDSKRHLYEQYALGEIDLETYRTRKAVYDTELVQAKNVHAVITAQTKQIKSDYEIKLKQQEIMQEVGNANMLTKALIDRLINKVYVFPGERIEIEYATQDFLETKESEKEV